ncbi:hypothetical protein GF352_00515 [archaeon]|nr:hypothetical protein [archaeon]
MRGQSAIISTVLLSGIILAIVSATFIWGQPLVQKTTDKVKIDTIVDDLTLIKDNIEHTQQTGSPSVVNLNIQDATYHIMPDENGIVVRTTTLIPVITSYTYIPISYTELAYETELTDVDTSQTITGVSTPPGYDGGDIHFGNVTLEGTLYNVTVYVTDNTVYDHVCIYQGSDISDLNTECAEELGSINKAGTDFTISWVNSDGNEVIISGGEKENIGILGSDPAGIIAGKSQPVSNQQQVSLKLAYRSLKDANNRNYKTFIECSVGCRATTGVHRLRIERTRVERTSNNTYYYVKAYFE